MSVQQEILDWEAIDTVLLDMDGTLLDLYFDNHFWLEHVPKRYAEKHNWSLQQAKEHLEAYYHAKAGTLDWYCLDYWGEHLDLDILELKREIVHLIQVHPYAKEFLKWLKAQQKTVALVTNAHQGSLSLKMQRTGLELYFDAIYSSHGFRAPKEHQAFWHSLEEEMGFDKSRTLFVDDSASVLDAARKFGIGMLLAISKPDSQRPKKEITDYLSVESFESLFKAHP